jgi:hypothetical protein
MKVRPACARARTNASYAFRNFWYMFIKYRRDEQTKVPEETHLDVTFL